MKTKALVWKIIGTMSKDRFQELGQALRIFLEDFRSKKNFKEKGQKILQLAKQLKEPHLEREVKQFVEKLEQFLASPDEKLSFEIAKLALHLEEETREI